MYDVIIIGGGIAGLQLGALLSNDCLKVLILEKTKNLGGRAFVWGKSGFVVDYGIHLIRFGEKSAIAKTCKQLGNKIEFNTIGKSYVKDIDGRLKLFPIKPLDFIKPNILTRKDKLKAMRIFWNNRNVNIDSLLNISVKEWMNSNKIDGALHRYITLISSSMQVCPFIERSSMGELLLNIKKTITTRKPTKYPKNGWKEIFEILEKAILKNGEIRTDVRVDSIIVKNNTAIGVEVKGRKIFGNKIVCAIPCQSLFEIVDENLCPSEFVSLCKSLRPTAGVSIDFGLKKIISNSTGLIFIWNPISFGIFTSNLSPKIAPKGKQLFTIFSPMNVEDMEDSSLFKKRGREIESSYFEMYPEMEENIEWKRELHLKMVDGVEINVQQTRPRRPAFSVPNINNLFLVGDSLSAPGAGGDVGHESVHLCYKEITGNEI